MRLIAIETAIAPGSLAALEIQPSGGLRTTSIDLPEDRRTAEILAPHLRELLDQVGWATTQIDAVAVTVGPGSFTGLRIGVTTAKTLAYASGAPCAPLNTLAVLAAQTGEETSGWVAIDAQRQELFAAPFSAGKLQDEPTILSRDTWLQRLAPGETVVGPVLKSLRTRLPEGVTAAAESAWRPRAETVARLAVEIVESGQAVSPFELLPNYYRLSAAEEKHKEKQGS